LAPSGSRLRRHTNGIQTCHTRLVG
jgi:hypothetical protein